eukprot:101609_1
MKPFPLVSCFAVMFACSLFTSALFPQGHNEDRTGTQFAYHVGLGNDVHTSPDPASFLVNSYSVDNPSRAIASFVGIVALEDTRTLFMDEGPSADFASNIALLSTTWINVPNQDTHRNHPTR